MNANQTDGAKGAKGADGADGADGAKAERGTARRRVGKMRGGLNWQNGEGRESIYKTI